jgi:hypothetical protein
MDQAYQREDDKAETVISRIVSALNNNALIDYYRRQGVLIEVDGSQPIGAFPGPVGYLPTTSNMIGQRDIYIRAKMCSCGKRADKRHGSGCRSGGYPTWRDDR